ncbi:MAG TPA: hypothetical protein VE913_23600, partial [Longimicrobium sp.]|nr:hypothetical protein [Longimicrobium sp.]
MQHLSLEVLARLVDEPAEPREAEHLCCCLVCRRELNALREQTAALSSLADPEPAPGAWESLETALLGEGLIRAAAPAPRRRAWPPALRIAASVAIFALGAASGATLLRGPGSPPQGIATLPRSAETSTPLALAGPTTTGPTQQTAGSTGATAASTELAAVPRAGESAAPLASRARTLAESAAPPATRPVTAAAVGAPARTVSKSGARLAARRPTRPTSDGATARELAEAEAAYVAALRRYAELADPSSGADPVTRLAALEMLV